MFEFRKRYVPLPYAQLPDDFFRVGYTRMVYNEDGWKLFRVELDNHLEYIWLCGNFYYQEIKDHVKSNTSSDRISSNSKEENRSNS